MRPIPRRFLLAASSLASVGVSLTAVARKVGQQVLTIRSTELSPRPGIRAALVLRGSYLERMNAVRSALAERSGGMVEASLDGADRVLFDVICHQARAETIAEASDGTIKVLFPQGVATRVRSRRHSSFAALAAMLLVGAALSVGSARADEYGNWQSGKEVYAKVCGRCHETGVGPMLRGLGLPEETIIATARSGLNAMPAFRRSEIDDKSLRAVAKLIDSMPAPAPKPVPAQPAH